MKSGMPGGGARLSGTIAAVIGLSLLIQAAAPPPAMARRAAGVRTAVARSEDPPAPPGGRQLELPDTPIKPGAAAGYLPASGEVSPDGRFTYELPLDVPAGRAGMQPSLVLRYASGLSDGPLGVGWALSGGGATIERCGSTLASNGAVKGVEFGGGDQFCLGGDRLVSVSGVSVPYGAPGAKYRTETDGFAEITSLGGSAADGPGAFVVKTRSGRIQTYSVRAVTRMKSGIAADGAEKVLATTQPNGLWLLDRESDRNGNEIRYSYSDHAAGDATEWLLDEIDYTLRKPATGPLEYGSRKVVLEYQDRPDSMRSFHAGVWYLRDKRLSSIKMYAPDPAATAMVWQYALTYGLSHTKRSRLESVAKCGPSGACLKARRFRWHDPDAVPGFAEQAVGPVAMNTSGHREPAMHVLDLDGDGADDVIYTGGGGTGPNDWDTAAPIFARLGSRDAKGTVSPLAVSSQLSGSASAWPAKAQLLPSRPVDLQSDGAAEFLVRSDAFAGASAKVAVLRWDKAAGKFADAGVPQYDSDLVEFGDLDGDGRMDLIQAPAAGQQYSYRLNTSGTSVGFGLSKPTGFTAGCPKVRVGDYDGDGRAELIGHIGTGVPVTCSSEPFRSAAYVKGTAESLAVSDGVKSYRIAQPYAAADVPGDFNGDGLEDYLRMPGGEIAPSVIFSTGDGLVGSGLNSGVPAGAEVRAADFNGDGRDDLVAFMPASTTVYISVGNGQFISGQVDNSGGTYDPQTGFGTSKVGDFNGDGRADVVRVKGGQVSLLTQTASTFADRIVDVSDQDAPAPLYTVVYGNMWTDHVEKLGDYTCGYPLVCPRRGMIVVRGLFSAAHNVDLNPDTESPTMRTLYFSYEDPLTDLRGRGWLGFGVMRIWDPQTPSETTYTYAHRQVVNGRYYPGAGRPADVVTVVPIMTGVQSTALGTTTRTARVTHTVNAYETRKLNTDLTFAVLDAGSVTTSWEEPVTIEWGPLGGATGSAKTQHITDVDLGAAPLRTLTTTIQPKGHKDAQGDDDEGYDDFGNLKYVTITTKGGTTTSTRTVYDNRTADWLIGLPVRQQVTRAEPGNDPPAVTHTVDFSYDALGRLEKAEVEKASADPDVRQTTAYTYSDRGVLTKVITTAGDPAAPSLPPHESHIEYDPVFPGQPDEDIYPSATWSQHDVPAYRPVTWTAVQPAYGVTVASMDANGVQTQATFDEFGRVLTVKREGQAQTTVGYAPRGDTVGGDNGVITTTGHASITTEVSTDALGRRLATRQTGFEGTLNTLSKIRYDLLGRAVARTGAAPEGTTSFAYDSLDRVTTTTTPDQKTTSYAYGMTAAGSSAVTTDPAGSVTTAYSDVDDRLVDAAETLTRPGNAPQELHTTYRYAPFDLLAKIVNAKGQVTSMDYDVRGRRIRLADPDRGTTVTTYHGTGQIDTQTHQETGHSTVFAYDDLGRAIRQTTEDGGSDFVYDTAAGGIGALAYAVSPFQVRTDFRYDNRGRAIGVDVTDQATGAVYRTDTGYDSAGRLLTVQFPAAGPGRLSLQYDYLSHGHLSGLRYAEPGDPTLKDLYTVTSRKPNLALDTATWGNGVTIKRAYDSGTARAHSLTATAAGGAKVQDLTYTYYDDGQIKERIENDATTGGAPRTETYTYDSLKRLTNWNLKDGAAVAKDFGYGYDPLGNVDPAGEDRAYGVAGHPDLLANNDATGIGGQFETYGYDGEGRQTTVTDESGAVTRQVAYTAFDLPKTITKNGVTTTYRYDAFGTRFSAANSTQTTITVGGFQKRVTRQGGVRYVHQLSGPDGPIAQVVTTGNDAPADVQYTVADHQGSVTATVGANGAVTGAFRYAPFGMRVNADGTPFTGAAGDAHHGYTGHEMEDDLGLINMRGRMYDPGQDRFLTPDPAIADAASSQDWNPYAYVRNSPPNYTDPSGYMLNSCRYYPDSGSVACTEGGGDYSPCGCGFGDNRLNYGDNGGDGGGRGGGRGGGGVDHDGVDGGGAANDSPAKSDADSYDDPYSVENQRRRDLEEFHADSEAVAEGGIAAAYSRCHFCAEADAYEADFIATGSRHLEEQAKAEAAAEAEAMAAEQAAEDGTIPDVNGLYDKNPDCLIDCNAVADNSGVTRICDPSGACRPVQEGSKICNDTGCSAAPGGTSGEAGSKEAEARHYENQATIHRVQAGTVTTGVGVLATVPELVGSKALAVIGLIAAGGLVILGEYELYKARRLRQQAADMK
ncbi:VCBS repeat-containing protein [Streptosporangiaceae bacterium NEAU-GS5]|nr:VCBS repeat-containing protein [Streptosporangiaceae bacterium NEAU-GS5]